MVIRPFASLFAAALLVVSVQATPAPADVPPQDGARVRLEAVRFWRGDRTTLLEGVIVTPAAESPPEGGGAAVEVVIRDAEGRELHRERWSDSNVADRIAARGRAERATPFAVALAPGRYTIEARFHAGTAVETAETEVRAFDEEPLISDVLLSPAIRVLREGERPTGGEVVKGRYAIVRGVRPTLTPERAVLDYYVELYRPEAWGPAEVEVEVAVWPLAGGAAPLVRTTQTVNVSPPGTPSVGRLNLAGLPPGEYRLSFTAKDGERREERSGEFAMASFAQVAAMAAPAPTPSEVEARLLERYFGPDVRGDSAIRALTRTLWRAPPVGSVPNYVLELSPEAQRRYLARYWSRLDPEPGTPQHELLEEYLRRAEIVEQRYAEREIGRAGIDTDRGRIYMKHGDPDAVLERQIGTNRGFVQVWRYTRDRSLKYVFLDETGFRNFVLVYTNDPNEPSLPDWTRRIGDGSLLAEIENF